VSVTSLGCQATRGTARNRFSTRADRQTMCEYARRAHHGNATPPGLEQDLRCRAAAAAAGRERERENQSVRAAAAAASVSINRPLSDAPTIRYTRCVKPRSLVTLHELN